MANPQQTLPDPPITDLRLLGWPVSFLNWLVRLKLVLLKVAQGDIVLSQTNKVVVTDNTGALTTGGATSTEVGYLSGVTGGIQSQINNKQNTITGAATTITTADLTANRALISNASGKVAVSATVSDTELGYLDGVTSGVQGQIDKKLFVSDTGGNAAWDDFSFNFLSLASVGVGVPALAAVGTTSRYGYEYTNEAVAANEKRQAFGVQSSHGVVVNSEIRFHVHIYTGSRVPAVDEYVRFEANMGVTNRGAVANTTAYAADCLIPAGTPAYTHVTCPIVTLTGTNIGPSSDIGGLLRRKSSVASDTYEGSVYLVFGDPHCQINRRGTAGEYT